MPDQTTETTPGERRRRFDLLARERAGDKTVLWRVGAWAGVAIVSVVIAAVVANSPTGARHGALLAANSLIAEQHKQIQQFATLNERESRRLANAVETLNADRNRLFKRVTDLEHNLDTVTGSVSRFAAAQPPSPAQITPPPANVSAPATQPATEPSKADSAKPDAVRPEAAKAEPQKTAETAKSAPAPQQAARPEVTGSAAAPKAEPKPDLKVAAAAELPKIEIVRVEPKSEPTKSEAAKSEAAKGTAKDAARSEPAKPDTPPLDPAKLDITRTEPVKPAPAKTDTAKPEKKAVEAAAPPSPQAAAPKEEAADDVPTGTVNRTQFGIDLGHASSVEGLRAIWSATRKMHGALVDGLQPIISIREQSNGMGMQLRLVAGPMTDAAAAAKLCAQIGDDDRPCRTAVYDGQRLAMRGDTTIQPEAAAPPRSSSKSTKSARPERKPRVDPKSQTRFNFPFFSQQ